MDQFIKNMIKDEFRDQKLNSWPLVVVTNPKSSNFLSPKVSVINMWIRCTFWFDAGSRIFENDFRWCFFLFLAHTGALTLRGPILIPFSNLAGQS